jgi:hypothetical protein
MLTCVKCLPEPKIFRRRFVRKNASHILRTRNALLFASTMVSEPKKSERVLQNHYIMPTFPNSSTLTMQRARDIAATIMQPQIRNRIIIMDRVTT